MIPNKTRCNESTIFIWQITEMFWNILIILNHIIRNIEFIYFYFVNHTPFLLVVA